MPRRRTRWCGRPAAGVLVMEAMWTRFLPQTDVIAQLLADGVLGEVTTVLADHGQYFDPDPQSRLFDPALAGGAMLDLGVYPISFASFVLGPPDAVVATGSLTDAGVDAQVSITLTSGSAQACLNTTLLARTPTTASISGSAGRIELSGPFYAPGTLTLSTAAGEAIRPGRPDRRASGAVLRGGPPGPAGRRRRVRVAAHAAGRDGADPAHHRRDPPPARRHLPGRIVHSRPGRPARVARVRQYAERNVELARRPTDRTTPPRCT